MLTKGLSCVFAGGALQQMARPQPPRWAAQHAVCAGAEGALGEGQRKPLARCFLRVMTWRAPAGPVLLEVLGERRPPVVQLRRVFTFFQECFIVWKNVMLPVP